VVIKLNHKINNRSILKPLADKVYSEMKLSDLELDKDLKKNLFYFSSHQVTPRQKEKSKEKEKEKVLKSGK
jgi:hypothetical protein